MTVSDLAAQLLLVARGVTKRFGAVEALGGLDFGTHDRRATAREVIVAAITGASPGRAVAA
jgi:hypothetical protein